MGEGLELEGHTSRSFDAELSALQLRVVEAGSAAARLVAEAARAYVHWDGELAREVVVAREHVEASVQSIEDESLSLIARRQPVAADLRAIRALSRIAWECERAASAAARVGVAVVGQSGAVAQRPGPATARDVRQIARLAHEMLEQALHALDRLDPQEAAVVVGRDAELDREFAAGLRRLISRAMEDSRLISVALDSAFVLKSFERVGDHARNVSALVLGLSPPERQARHVDRG
jgi:phosphate transport system protein